MLGLLPGPALVADMGTDTFRAGCAGDEAPRVVVPPLPGDPGEQLLRLLERVAGTAAGRSACLGRPVLLAEPDFCSQAHRRSMAEMLFEGLRLPAVATMKSSPLSALAFGHTSAAVVDVGAARTSVVPVWGCRISAQHAQEHPFAGRALDAAVLKALREQGVEVQGAPEGRAASPASAWVAGEHPSVQRIAQDLKETVCFCSHVPLAQAEPAAPFVHTLPDGQQVDVAAFSRSVPEALLVGDGQDFPGLPSMLGDSLMAERGSSATGAEAPEVALLVGGSSLLVNLRDRLEAALEAVLPPRPSGRPRVKASASRRHAAWLGGSVAASCGATAPIWTSRAEYEERGAAALGAGCA